LQSRTVGSAVSAEETMRADLYGLLGRVLFDAPDSQLLKFLQSLNGDTTPMGQAFGALAQRAAGADLVRARDEYDGLFIGVGRGELLPYGSYYLTGFLNEKPLANLRHAMADLGITRNDDVREPEDHIGSLMEMMAGLIVGRYGQPASLEVQNGLFSAHIAPWASHFFSDLETAKLSRLYQPVGTIGKLFMEIETDAFAMV
jgi:TorA maturation chaperone TorD